MESRNLSTPLHIPLLMPLLALLAAFPPLSTDMYLPAIPYLGELWNVDLKTINLTLICFFISYSPAILIYGPLSDRFGRRKPLLAGLVLFMVGSILCATAGSVQALICARILQGIGAAGPSSLGLSITKDYYSGSERRKILALTGIIVSLAPMIGPSLGSWAMFFSSWRIIFVFQVIIGIVAFVGIIRMPETHANPRHIPLSKMAGPYLALFKNTSYLYLTMLFAVSMSPFFAFIAASSDIYIIGFGVSEQTFGFLFAFNAIFLMAGSFSCMQLSKKLDDLTVVWIGFGGILASGLLLMIIPHSGFWFFTLPMCLLSYCFGLTRPLCVDMILQTINSDIGSASSLMMFSNFVFGALAMGAISMCGDWKITIIGLMAVLSGLLTIFVLWFMSQGTVSLKQR